MTYDMIPTNDLKTAVNKALSTRGSAFLPGDGFDKNNAPMLDDYATAAGYTVVRCGYEGKGQLKSVTTECGVKIYRNGYCHKV